MRYYLDPFGCVKNQVDAETMMAYLNGSGWVQAEEAETADLIIVNSCGFIESAKRESINAVLAWRRLYPEKKILLAGCLSQRYAPELAEALPEADFLFGNADLSRIGEAAGKALGREEKQEKGKPAMSGEAAGKRPLLSLPGSAYIKISEGCNNRCTFCAIPLIRGGSRSRTIPDVVDECRVLLSRGVRELCLIGQDIGSYGRDLNGVMLPELLQSLSALKGEFWVRLLYIHPDNFPLSILDIMKKDPRILPYFDIPFQHGSEKILKAMNRRGNAETYLSLVETIRGQIPGAVIRSTFMTGFPGETEEDFRRLLDFQEKVRPDWLGCFAWSREENTPAYSMKGRVAKKTALERKRLIEERQIPITERQMDRFVGQSVDVLIEERFSPAAGASGDDGLYLGRLPCHAPEVDGSAVITSGRELVPGTLVRGRIFARAGFDLELRV